MTADSNVKTERLMFFDTVRGILLVGMIGYHAMWDLVFLLGHYEYTWYTGVPGMIWQKTVCCGFIFLSGFCTVLGHRLLMRGIIVSLCGAVIMAVTAIVMPENRVVFGVLTLHGASMIITAGLRRLFPLEPAGEKKHCPLYAVICVVCIIACILFQGTMYGYLGTHGHPLVYFPAWLYRNYVTAFFGFSPAGFHSTDYFPLLPWYFLFLAGETAGRIFRGMDWLKAGIFKKGLQPFAFLGKHSLLIYMLHQPVLYGIFMLWSLH